MDIAAANGFTDVVERLQLAEVEATLRRVVSFADAKLLAARFYYH